MTNKENFIIEKTKEYNSLKQEFEDIQQKIKETLNGLIKQFNNTHIDLLPCQKFRVNSLPMGYIVDSLEIKKGTLYLNIKIIDYYNSASYELSEQFNSNIITDDGTRLQLIDLLIKKI